MAADLIGTAEAGRGQLGKRMRRLWKDLAIDGVRLGDNGS